MSAFPCASPWASRWPRSQRNPAPSAVPPYRQTGYVDDYWELILNTSWAARQATASGRSPACAAAVLEREFAPPPCEAAIDVHPHGRGELRSQASRPFGGLPVASGSERQSSPGSSRARRSGSGLASSAGFSQSSGWPTCLGGMVRADRHSLHWNRWGQNTGRGLLRQATLARPGPGRGPSGLSQPDSPQSESSRAFPHRCCVCICMRLHSL